MSLDCLWLTPAHSKMKVINIIIHIKIYVNGIYRRHFRIKIFWYSCYFYFHSFIYSTYSALYYFKGQFRITILPSIMTVWSMTCSSYQHKGTKIISCLTSSLIITIKQDSKQETVLFIICL